jgi:hypothetical protein
MFAMVFKLFSCVFTSVSETCFKYFICLQIYVTSVASECYKVDWVLHMLQYCEKWRGHERSLCAV